MNQYFSCFYSEDWRCFIPNFGGFISRMGGKIASEGRGLMGGSPCSRFLFHYGRLITCGSRTWDKRPLR